MKFIKKATIFTLIMLILTSVGTVFARQDGRVVILLYHNLRDGELIDTDAPEYCTTDVKFEQDILDLFALGYKSLSLEQYYKGDYKKSENHFIITFDDGYLSNYTIAYPIMLKHKVYGDIFMCTENTTLVNHFKYSDANEMEKSGYIKIYSHLTKHLDVTSLKSEEFQRLAVKSYRYLEKRISDNRLMMFAYPSNLFNEETAKYLYNSGTVMQFVQSIPSNMDWDYKQYGIYLRVTVAYYSNMENLLIEYWGD